MDLYIGKYYRLKDGGKWKLISADLDMDKIYLRRDDMQVIFLTEVMFNELFEEIAE